MSEDVLENLDKNTLVQMYNNFVGYEKNILTIKENQKNIIGSIKRRIADLENLVNKKNEIDPKKVKAGLLKKALSTYLEKINKIEQDLEIMESYLVHFKNKEVPSEQSIKYGETIKNLKEKNSEYKLSKKKALNEVDESIVVAITYLANKSAVDELSPNVKANNELKENGLKENEPELIKKHIELVKSLSKILK